MRNFLSKTILPKKIFKSIVKVVASTAFAAAFAIGLSTSMNFAHAACDPNNFGADAPGGVLNREYVKDNLCGATEIKISDKVTKIDERAFKDCKSLTSVDFLDCRGLTILNNCAFESCDSLKEVKLPASLKSIGEGAFFECQSLERMDLSRCTSLKNIGLYTFIGCKNLSGIKLPASLKGYIGDNYFPEGCTINFV